MCGNFSLMMALLLIRLHRIQQFEDLPESHRELVAKQSLHVYAPWLIDLEFSGLKQNWRTTLSDTGARSVLSIEKAGCEKKK